MKQLLIPLLLLCSACSGYVVDKPIMGVALDGGHDLSRGLIGVWLFNDRLGVVGKAYDLSGNGNHGTLINDTHSAPGRFGNALDFDGSGDYINVGEPPSLDQNFAQLTLVAWARKTSGATNRALVGKETIWYLALTTDTNLRLRHSNLGDGRTDVTIPDSGGEWHQFAATCDGTQTAMYYDGVFMGGEAVSGSLGVNASPVGLGAYVGTGTWSWNGQIDHILIYDRALTDGEIQSLYIASFQMFEQEHVQVAAAAAAPAGGQVITVIMSRIPPVLGVGLVIGGLALAFGWSGRKAA